MNKRSNFHKFKPRSILKKISFRKVMRQIKSSVIITTGGSGGHILPAAAVAKNLVEQGKKVIFLSDRRIKNVLPILKEKDFFNNINFTLVELPVIPFHSEAAFKFFFLSILTFFKSLFLIFKHRPQIILGFGSYATAFPLLASVVTCRKIILHEQNVIFGKVNKFFLRFANAVLLSFPDTSFFTQKEYKLIKDKYIISGLPNFLNSPTYDRPFINKIIYDLAYKTEIVIVITGGSAGATFFSENIPLGLVMLAKAFPLKNFIIYQQAKKHDIDKALTLYAEGALSNIKVHIKDCFENMPELLSIADFSIIRGGAGSIIESSLSKVFSIIIPMPASSNNHQFKNATVLSKNNAGVTFNQKDYTPEKLFLILSKAINEGLFYFPVINTAYDLFKSDALKTFYNVILYNELINI